MSTPPMNTGIPEKGRRLALVVGVNRAPNAQIPSLEYAVADAEAMVDVLSQHCYFEILDQPLIGEQATSDRVKKAILRLTRNRRDDDFLLLYFSGHGHPMMIEAERRDVYLVTADFDEVEVEEDENAHLSMRWLRDKLYVPTNAGRVLLILDCCYAGDIGRTAPDPYLEELHTRITYYFDAPGRESGARQGGLRLALTATGHGATATEKAGHGLMTGRLLPALRGEVDEALDDDGQVSLPRLFEYLQRSVPPEQQPSLAGDFAGRLCILASYPDHASALRSKRHVVNDRPRNYIPFQRDPLFQSRPGEFERLEAILFESGVGQKPIRLGLVGVVGMAGVGKTQLAKELAHHCLDQGHFSSGVFWMPAPGTSFFDWRYQLAELAVKTEYLPPEDDLSNPENEVRRARHLCRYLASHNDALLILDNVEEPELIDSFLPKLAGEPLACTLLYTSRNTFCPPGVITHLVEPLSEEASLRLLLEATRPSLLSEISIGSQSKDAKAAREICKVVGYLPLALVLLREMLARDQRGSVEELNMGLKQLLQQGPPEHLNEILKRLSRPGVEKKTLFGNVAPLFAAFRLSWKNVHNEEAQRLFRLAAYFPEATPIPLWLLGLAAGLGEDCTFGNPLWSTLMSLQELSLIETLNGNQVRLHPLLRAFERYLVTEELDKGKSLLEETGRRLATEFADLKRLEKRALRVGYWECLGQTRAAVTYTELLRSDQTERLQRVERWLDREGYLLADQRLWPTALPALFYQQLANRSVEEGHALNAERVSLPWLKLTASAGAEDRSILRILVGHNNRIESVAFSPDGKLMLTGSDDRTTRLWGVSSGRLLVILQGHSDQVRSVAFSPDGRLMLTGSDDHTARLWETSTGQSLATLQGHSAEIRSIAFSSDGKLVLTGSWDTTARLWEMNSGRLLVLQGHSDQVTSATFSPDGKLVLTGSNDCTARLWETSTGRLLTTLQGHTNWVSSVAFSPDGKLALTGSLDHTARLWEASSGQLRVTLQGHTNWVSSVAFSPDGKLALTGSWDTTARLWDTKSGQLLATLGGHSDQVRSVAFSPDGKLALTGSWDTTARLWDTKGYQVTSAAFSPGGKLALGGLDNHTADQRETHRGQWIPPLQLALNDGEIFLAKDHSAGVIGAAFSLDGKRMLTGSNDCTARLWETSTGRLLTTLQGHSAEVRSVAFSPDGKLVLTGSDDHTARLWETSTGRLLTTLQGHSAEVTYVAFSPDGKRMLTGSNDCTARLWETSTGRLLTTLQNRQLSGKLITLRDWVFSWLPSTLTIGYSSRIRSVAFSPDGKLALTASLDHVARLWETNSGRLRATLRGHSDNVTSMAFSPDGRLALTGSLDRTARLWETDNGHLLTILGGHSASMSGVMFSPDGKLVLTGSWAFSTEGKTILHGSWDNMIRLWETGSGQLLAISEGPNSSVTCAAFSPDGRLVITGDENGWILLRSAYEQQRGRLLGMYVATYGVRAVHWLNERHVVLADTGELHGSRPHFYQLKLEGEW